MSRLTPSPFCDLIWWPARPRWSRTSRSTGSAVCLCRKVIGPCWSHWLFCGVAVLLSVQNSIKLGSGGCKGRTGHLFVLVWGWSSTICFSLYSVLEKYLYFFFTLLADPVDRMRTGWKEKKSYFHAYVVSKICWI